MLPLWIKLNVAPFLAGALFALLALVPTAAHGSTVCKASKPPGVYAQWRVIDGRRCWYSGRRKLGKGTLYWPRPAPPPKRVIAPAMRAFKLDDVPAEPALSLDVTEPEPEPEAETEEPAVRFSTRFAVTAAESQALAFAPPEFEPPALWSRIETAPSRWPAVPYPLLLFPFALAIWTIYKAAPPLALAHHHNKRRLQMVDHNTERLERALRDVAPQQPPHPPQQHERPRQAPHVNGAALPTLSSAAAEATRNVAAKLIEESRAALGAARKILEMLEAEHEVYAKELMRHTEHHAQRIAEYLEHCGRARDAMANHRESMMEVGRSVANDPIAERSQS
jgi:hypothetical protein